METVFMLCVGILLIVLGIFNAKGDINSVHWYNRTRITQQNRMQYGRSIGVGTIICGAGLVVSAILLFFELEALGAILSGVFFLVGFGFITYGQIKYNKGFF